MLITLKIPFFYIFTAAYLIYSVLSNSFVSASEINLSRSKLVQLALHLEVADQEKQYEFSRIALLEMYDTYQYELDRSFTHLPKTQKKRAKVRHWRFATQSYLETINNYLYLMDSGTGLSFFVSRQNKIFLLIGDVPVIISGPNSGADKQIERNIVEQFCLQYDCREYFEKTHYSTETTSTDKNPTEAADNLLNNNSIYQENTGEWSLEANHKASFAMSNGLIFKFSNLKNRKYKELWAIEISNELFILVDHLLRAQEKGKVISWSSLTVEELPSTDSAFKVVVNQNNDYLKLSIPFLGENPVLFKTLIPWLKKFIDQQSDYRMVINNADQYLIQR